MRNIVKPVAAFGLAAVMGATAGPAFSAPPVAPAPKAPDVVRVQMQDLHDEVRRNRWNRPRDYGHRDYRHRFYRDGDHYYFNGHRGHRHRRAGYRYYNGWWFPPAAFIAGAIIAGEMSRRDRYYDRYDYYRGDLSRAHVEWCYARYRSYREWDNTYQPYGGPRRQCYSPYS